MNVEISRFLEESVDLCERIVRCRICKIECTQRLNPLEMVKLLAASTRALEGGGLLLVKAVDEISNSRGGGEKISALINSSYNPITGEVIHTFFNFVENKVVKLKRHPWSLSTLLALTWAFYKDVKLVDGSDVYIAAREPRCIYDDFGELNI